MTDEVKGKRKKEKGKNYDRRLMTDKINGREKSKSNFHRKCGVKNQEKRTCIRTDDADSADN